MAATIWNLTGYQGYFSSRREGLPPPAFCARNGLYVSSYVPGLAIIHGLAMFTVARDSENPASARVYAAIRGVCSFLGIGALFLILDLIVTIGRQCCGIFCCQKGRNRAYTHYQNNNYSSYNRGY